MKDTICRRCSKQFYTANTGGDLNCPFCGYPTIAAGQRRHEDRSPINSGCYIAAGAIQVPAKASDISEKGLGVIMPGPFPFDKDDTLTVTIEGFRVDSCANVVWIRKIEDGSFKAGLKFC